MVKELAFLPYSLSTPIGEKIDVRQDASLSTDGPDHPKRLTFRVIPVNFIRPSFFKRRAKKNALLGAKMV